MKKMEVLIVNDSTVLSPKDLIKINVLNSQESKYWANKLKVPESQIITAVASVGPFVEDIKYYLSIS